GTRGAVATTNAYGKGTDRLTIEMQPLGNLGGQVTRGLSVNESGHVVGLAITADVHQHGFFWSPSGMVDIPPFSGDEHSVAWLINSADQGFGASIPPFPGSERLASWKDGSVIDGGSMSRFLTPTDANDLGHVVGYSDNSGFYTERCFYWSAERGLEEIIPFAGARGCTLMGVNASGQAVGSAYESPVSFGSARAFLYDYNTRAVTFLVPRSEDASYGSYASGINDLGHVIVGITTRRADGTFESRGYLWTPSAPLVDMGRPADADTILGLAINNLDHIVG